MTHRVSRLEERRYLVRKMSKEDRRIVMVFLTDKALKVIERAAQARFHVADTVFGSLSATQIDQLNKLLDKLIEGAGGEQPA